MLLWAVTIPEEVLLEREMSPGSPATVVTSCSAAQGRDALEMV
jgi:hypothetical protein